MAAHVARAVFEKNLIEFDRKSHSGADEFGDAWKPLEPSTVARKLAEQQQGKGKRRPRFEALVDQYSLRLKRQKKSKFATREKAKRKAQQFIDSGLVQINVDTGRLRNSLRPGWVGSSGYVRRPEQVFLQHEDGYAFGTRVPYARHVHRARPIFPSANRARRWVVEGIAASLGSLARLLR